MFIYDTLPYFNRLFKERLVSTRQRRWRGIGLVSPLFDCIAPNYVPPLPGRDGLYYYPHSWYPTPDNYCYISSGCFKGNLPHGDCTPNKEFGNCDKNKWDCNDFDECKSPSSYCFPNTYNDTGPPEINLTGPPLTYFVPSFNPST
ncbi:MAG: hypothetical protein ABJB85_06070 [Nitrososphaerota archaeon]